MSVRELGAETDYDEYIDLTGTPYGNKVVCSKNHDSPNCRIVNRTLVGAVLKN
jgi:hypothetical protein